MNGAARGAGGSDARHRGRAGGCYAFRLGSVVGDRRNHEGNPPPARGVPLSHALCPRDRSEKNPAPLQRAPPPGSPTAQHGAQEHCRSGPDSAASTGRAYWDRLSVW